MSSKFNYDPGKAIKIRKEDALAHFGLTRQNIINQISSRVLANVRTYRDANNVQDEAEFTAMMRKLGGFSEMIDVVIGPRPGSTNENDPAYWLWIIKTELVGAVRERVQLQLSGEQI